jgi:hypothetical protein
MTLHAFAPYRRLNAQVRVYAQVLRQKRYTALPHAVLCLQKFGAPERTWVPAVRQVSWAAGTQRPKLPRRHLLLIHLLLTWLTKQAAPLVWHPGRRVWSSTSDHGELVFYELRYRMLPLAKHYPFVPTLAWRKINPRALALFPAFRSLTLTPFPLFVREFLQIFTADNNRFSFSIRCRLPVPLPPWYSKVLTLRTHHYPVVYDKKTLRLLVRLSLTPLKEGLVFDEITGKHNTARKARLAYIFKTLLGLGRKRAVVVEPAVYWRIVEQMQKLPGQSTGADFFQKKWFAYFYPMLAAA